jgi:threonine dehydratase
VRPEPDLNEIIEEISNASSRLTPVLPPTPLTFSDTFSRRFDREVYLKREDLQPVRSYKLRGAYNMIAAHLEAAPITSVVCASAGNHAQGVAWACARLAIPATIVLPARTPRQKRDRIAVLGGEWVTVELVAGVYDDAATRAKEISEHTGALLVPPFDHPLVVAGQATVTDEILTQLPATDQPYSFVFPVGGGGVAAGAALALERHRQSGSAPAVAELVLAEPAGAASLKAARLAGHPVALDEIDTFVDGAATRSVGVLPFEILQHSDGPLPMPHVSVPEGAVAAVMLDLYTHDGIIAEPAGALALAALEHLPGTNPVVVLLSGGNNDVSRYQEASELAMVHRGLRHYFLVEFPQTPGALRRFLDEVLAPGDDIVLFEYVKRSERETGPAMVGIDIATPEGITALLARLDTSPIRYSRITPGSQLSRFLL